MLQNYRYDTASFPQLSLIESKAKLLNPALGIMHLNPEMMPLSQRFSFNIIIYVQGAQAIILPHMDCKENQDITIKVFRTPYNLKSYVFVGFKKNVSTKLKFNILTATFTLHARSKCSLGKLHETR